MNLQTILLVSLVFASAHGCISIRPVRSKDHNLQDYMRKLMELLRQAMITGNELWVMDPITADKVEFKDMTGWAMFCL